MSFHLLGAQSPRFSGRLFIRLVFSKRDMETQCNQMSFNELGINSEMLLYEIQLNLLASKTTDNSLKTVLTVNTLTAPKEATSFLLSSC